MSVPRTGEIKALTGLRIVAALWVVLFHFRPLLWEASPRLQDDLAPLLNSGAQGVDLFFILSGFVLTWNYLERMGPAWSRRATLHFLWLRLSRVWPVYLVTMHIAALWIIFTLHVGTVPSPAADKLTAISYLRQFFMVQLWFEPFFDGTSWDGPAWSISAEWLAYLVFGLAVLIIFRMSLVTRARSLLLLAFVATLPPTVLLLASGHFYTPWSWLPRILCQFVAGALACAAVRRLRLSDRAQRVAGYLSLLIVAVIVAVLYYYDKNPVAGMVDPGGVVDLLFMPLVVALTVGVGSLPRLLSTRLMVYGGQISFSLYMVHEIVHTTWNWAVIEYTIEMPKSTAKLVVVGLLLAALGAAMLLYHFVEEPARRWMRRMVDFRDVKTSDSTASDVRSADLKAGDLDTDGLKNGNVQAIGPVRESRGSARAV
jgi:peptidoglycan/LPS O-acetylase OafA/YrhL